jgi:RNA recognition motif-containing protein
MVRTKVFVGNLSFKTREAELAQEFAAAGPVIGANIITRGPRSLGYGFVEFDNEEDANNAVKIMSKKEIDGRPINVEVAKPREELQNTGTNDNNNTNSNDQQTDGTRGGFRGRGRGGFRGGRGGRGGRGRGSFRGRGGYRRRFDENGEETENTNVNNNNQTGEEGTRAPRRRFRRGGQQGVQNQGQETRTESKTTLFIANLPFSLDDAGFAKVFADNGLKYKSAHVVQKRNGRSKGFGFAEFDSQDDQQKALQTLNAKVVEERELIVKVALTEPQQQGENQQAPTEEKKE